MASDSDTSMVHGAPGCARDTSGPDTAALSLEQTQAASPHEPTPISDAASPPVDGGATTRTFGNPRDRFEDLEATIDADVNAPSEARPRTPKFLGEYELLDEIARGGMGVVYRARQVNLGRLVALKVIRDSSIASYSDLRRFRAEAEAVAQLDHPNIVPIYEVGQVEDQPYFSMKLIDGGNLTKYVHELKANPRAAAMLMIKVARAVHYAHQRAILHRDIKPSNILIGDRGEPYVTDFGLAKRFDVEHSTAETHSGAIMGTPAYMPPEQARGKARTLTTAADVYSLGATLYETLTGRAPFQAESLPEILRQVVEEEPQSIRSLSPLIDRDLETICLKCLEKDSTRRYGSAEALADDLENWLTDKTITARRASAKERATKWVRRHKALAALVATIVISLLSLGGGGIWFTIQLQGALSSAEDSLYIADVNLARRNMNEHLPLLGRDLLEKHRPKSSGRMDRRGFEWYFLRKRCEPLALEGHTAHLRALAFHPSGEMLASGGIDATLREWDVADKELLRATRVQRFIEAVAYSPDGKWLAAGGDNQTVIISDARSGEEKCRLEPLGGIAWGISFSSDSKRVSVCLPEAVLVFDLARREQVYSISSPGVQFDNTSARGLAFSPDGRWIAYATDKDVMICVAMNGTLPRIVGGHTSRVTSLAFSPDSRLLASSSIDKSVRLWDIESGNCVREFQGHTGAVKSIAFNSEGDEIATASEDRTARIWDVNTGRELWVLPHESSLQAVAIHPRANTLATAGDDAIVRLWNLSEVESIKFTGHKSPVVGVTINPAGNQIASIGADGMIGLWNLEAGLIPKAPSWKPTSSPPTSIAYSPDGRYLASSSSEGSIDIRDLESSAIVQTLRVPDTTLLSLAFSPDGANLTSAGTQAVVRTWSWKNGRLLHNFVGHDGTVFALAYSPDGKHIATGGGDHVVRLWNTATGQLERTLTGPPTTEFVRCLAFSSDGRMLAVGGSDASLMLWQFGLWGPTHVSLRGHSGSILSVAISPDGRRVASASADQTIKLWDTATGLETLTLKEHTKEVTGVAFSPDGEFLVSSSNDGTIRIWDASR